MQELPEHLPELRQDLQLMSAAPSADGSPRWSVYDPWAHQYVGVSRLGFAFISRWEAGAETQTWLDTMAKDQPELTTEELEEFVKTATRLEWFKASTPQASQAAQERFEAAQKSLFSKVLHGYLFFKIPIVKPEPWIGDLADRLLFLRSPLLKSLILTLGLLGLFAVFREWETFVSTFTGFLNLQGALAYFAAIVAIKIAHEFSHALAAKWHGAKVGSMGVAFLVLFPILYTDTTDSWRLQRRWDRLAIVLAGLKVELALAALALFFWSVLPPGQFRSLCFVVATTAIVSSFVVNLSPFMRFDGYFAMSDLTGVDNLQPRSFEVARWWMRRTLLGFSDPCPEPLSGGALFGMVMYSFATWIYRFFLFIGIAILVYSIAFKLIGILLFIIEIWFFVLRPIWRELMHWFTHRSHYSVTLTSALSLAILSLVVYAFFVPVQSTVRLPAVLTQAESIRVFPAETGVLSRPLQGAGEVKAGDLLAVVLPRELESEIEVARSRVRALEVELENVVATRRFDDLLPLNEELAGRRNELTELERRAGQGSLTAPFDGVWVPSSGLSQGRVWSSDSPIGSLTSQDQSQVVAYVTLAERDALAANATGSFLDDVGDTIELKSGLSVSRVSSSSLSVPLLASDFGGPLPVRRNDNELILDGTFYRVAGQVSDAEFAVQTRGVLSLRGQPESYASRLFKLAAAVLRQESGF